MEIEKLRKILDSHGIEYTSRSDRYASGSLIVRNGDARYYASEYSYAEGEITISGLSAEQAAAAIFHSRDGACIAGDTKDCASYLVVNGSNMACWEGVGEICRYARAIGLHDGELKMTVTDLVMMRDNLFETLQRAESFCPDSCSCIARTRAKSALYSMDMVLDRIDDGDDIEYREVGNVR